jgi:hypothetical protein
MPDFGAIIGQELWALTISLFGLSGLRFALGAFSALRDGTFVLSSLGAFLRSTILGRVFPILTVAYFAASVEGGVGVTLAAASATMGAAFVAETVGAIQEALSSTAQDAVAEKTTRGLQIGNPVPQD